MIWAWKYITLWLSIAATLQSCEADPYGNRIDKWPYATGGEHIKRTFFKAMVLAEDSKKLLQNQLKHFLENLQKNLTTSTMLSRLDDFYPKTERNKSKLHNLSIFFYAAASATKRFAQDSETYYEEAKNASYDLLLQLRHMPTTQPTHVKMLLTNYFSEMEFFHIMFCEILDQSLEHTQNTLLAIQKTFTYYADVQRLILENWSISSDIICCKDYMEFLEFYSSQIFKCATGNNLDITFDVFSMTELTSKYIMRQLEFRIEQLFNCFFFGNYEIRCKFLHNAERDFALLFSKIEELETYYDIKIKMGRVSAARLRRRLNVEKRDSDGFRVHIECIPPDFPQGQMHRSLKRCFKSMPVH